MTFSETQNIARSEPLPWRHPVLWSLLSEASGFRSHRHKPQDLISFTCARITTATRKGIGTPPPRRHLFVIIITVGSAVPRGPAYHSCDDPCLFCVTATASWRIYASNTVVRSRAAATLFVFSNIIYILLLFLSFFSLFPERLDPFRLLFIPGGLHG